MDPHQFTQPLQALEHIAVQTRYLLYWTLACLSVIVAFAGWAFVKIKDD